MTSFVGRSEEIGAATQLLGRVRLVTFLGPGGVGKTRTALRVAGQLAGGLDGGVCMVQLSSLKDPDLLAHSVSAALGLPEQPNRSQLDVLVDHLEDRELLLVLDTCEHIVDACGMLADVLLRTAPSVRILATSREPLDVPGEHTFPLMPLAVPSAQDGQPTTTDAMQLFADRAAAVVPGFVLSDGNRGAVAALCRRLDGIPLAIELAAVRLRALSLEQIVDRLSGRFRVLTGGSKVALPRHKTLRTAIDWSHDLCSPQERLLWARLSVFAGDFDLPSVEDVCADDALPAEEVVEQLIGLVDKSVVLRADDADEVRYRLLDTLREYGAEQLAERADGYAVQVRHRDHYLELARWFEAEWAGDEQMPRFHRLLRERANLRVALEFSYSSAQEAHTGLTLATTLWAFWFCASRLSEGRYWLHKGLELVPEPVAERSMALRYAGWYAAIQGDHSPELPLMLGEACDIAVQLGDERLHAHARAILGCVHMAMGRPEAAVELYEAAHVTLRELDDQVGILMYGYHLGFLHMLLGDLAAACDNCDVTLSMAGPEERWNRGWAACHKAVALWLMGDHEESARLARVGARCKYDLEDYLCIAHCLEPLAWIAAEEPEHCVRAAWLLGAVAGLYRRCGAVPMFGVSMLQEFQYAAERKAKQVLGETAYEAAFRGGATAPLDQVIARATGDEPPVAAPEPDEQVTPLGVLTRREREVATLVAEGLSNRQIAQRLVISKRTADAHVEHILTKLGFSSRAQIASLVGETARVLGEGANS
ncbi:LuxR C-terminal-related transcriptional regulator [Streptomyces sp. NBC_00006]|uniref:ATP-binding protein n=1 Tax=Streptomyces sp. NBC_00006 TaxID=2975619 RepID=UPI002257D7ED|nr:LuxR C-terminal-related transcriptional regulator [Streptomyces sp. NBC_00006]MCX5532314.1 LuxR C-terminal-related transcriptional regulator [Streptomyces sp. NBC_00006]